MAGTYNRKDHYYQRAKDEGLRSRASFKLKELDQRFGLIKRGFKILDLGAWPGGWLQVAGPAVGEHGRVIGIDLVEIEPLGLEQVVCITGDARDPVIQQRAREAAGGDFDLVVSDMSPKLSGIADVDRWAAVGLAELALAVAQQMLRPGGSFVVKVFKSNETEAFVKMARPLFNKLVRAELRSTRASSSEFYVVGFGLKKVEIAAPPEGEQPS